jgi:pyruvate kinase
VNAFRRTKIVATLGPASNSPERLRALIEAGVNVFRMNFSHGEHAGHRANAELVRSVAHELGRDIALLQDLQGPKIRTGRFADGKIALVEGASFALTCDDDSPGDHTRVGVTYSGLAADVKAGDTLLLDDGRLALRVEAVRHHRIETIVTLGGTLSNNKGINIPDADLSIPALTEKDIADLEYGATLEVDWVAMSFVRHRDDLLLAREHLERVGSKAKLMAKIEKPGAVERFVEILQEVDGVMVARGDLGVELPPERVPQIQKRLIRACLEAGKPVVTATQMLESMIQAPTPTRAEASDVANAIYDGTDAVMLSAETAVGAYPVEAVRMMARIARTVENDERYIESMREHPPTPDDTTADAVSLGVVNMSHALGAKLIVTFTSTGSTAARVARNRPSAPILAITPTPLAYRQMAMVWGVLPHLSDDIQSTDEMVQVAEAVIRERGLLQPGERFIITAGVPFGTRGTTNMIRVERFKG